MNVLVVGGTRFLGWHIVRRLLGDGHEVTLLNRGLSPDDLGDGVRRLRGDRRDPAAFARLAGGRDWDAVVDLIAYEPGETRAAVETLGGRTGHYFNIGTGAVYIVTRDYPCPLREEDFGREVVPRPDKNDGMWLYGTRKRACEDILAAARAAGGFPFTTFRLPIVMGERDYTLRAYSYILRAGVGKPILLPDGGLCPSTYVHPGDVASAVSTNLNNPASFGRAYNLAQREIVTSREIVLKAASILGTKPEIVDIPRRILEAAGLGTSFSPFSVRRPFILSTQKAEAELGFIPVPFEDSLRRTVLWYRDEYRGPDPENYLRRGEETALAARYAALLERL